MVGGGASGVWQEFDSIVHVRLILGVVATSHEPTLLRSFRAALRLKDHSRFCDLNMRATQLTARSGVRALVRTPPS